MNGAIASAPFLKIHANSHSIGKIYKLTVPLPPPSTIPSSLPFPLLCAVRLLQVENQWQKEEAQLS